MANKQLPVFFSFLPFYIYIFKCKKQKKKKIIIIILLFIFYLAASLTIIVEDENDNNPKFRKPFYKRSITENSPNGVTIANVVAYDIDKNRTIKYSLEGIIFFLLFFLK